MLDSHKEFSMSYRGSTGFPFYVPVTRKWSCVPLLLYTGKYYLLHLLQSINEFYQTLQRYNQIRSPGICSFAVLGVPASCGNFASSCAVLIPKKDKKFLTPQP